MCRFSTGACSTPSTPKRPRGLVRRSRIFAGLQNRIAQDVRTSWLNAISAYQRLSLTQQLLDQATQAFDLAKGRYQLGLSSIIELSQAQLSLTEAQVEQVSAQYDYDSADRKFELPVGRVK